MALAYLLPFEGSACLLTVLGLPLDRSLASSMQNLDFFLCDAQVIEAQLTLLLRLSSARRSSIAEVTDDVHIIGKLIDCKVIILPLTLGTTDPRIGSSCACLVSCSMHLLMVSSCWPLCHSA